MKFLKVMLAVLTCLAVTLTGVLLFVDKHGAGSHQCFKNEKNPFFSYGFSSAPVTV